MPAHGTRLRPDHRSRPGAGAYWPYTFERPDDGSIYVQGPAQLAGPDAMVGPGQTVVARRTVGGRGVQAIELAYEHEGEPWWQAHYLYRRPDGVLVFTAQSREPGVAAARSGVEWMMGLD